MNRGNHSVQDGHRQPSVWLAAVLLALLLTGCSALRIDVDVYKGPLASEPETQVRQFAALAMAAKPLLASLRNDLEDTERSQNGQLKLSEVVKNPGLLESFLDGEHVLQSRLARFVNGALLSYDDVELGPGLLARTSLAEVRVALEAVAPRKLLDLRLSERLQALTLPSSHQALAHEYRCWLQHDPALSDPACSSQQGRYRSAGPIFKACRGVNTGQRAELISCPEDSSANAVYANLALAHVVEGHAMLLFGKIDREFIERVNEIASGFNRARAATRDTLRHVLSALQTRSEPHVVQAAADAVAILLRRRTLICYLDGLEPTPKSALAQLKELMNEIRLKPAAEAQARLSSLLQRSPVEMASSLLDVDDRIPRLEAGRLNRCADGGSDAPARESTAMWRRFGLAVGPTEDRSLDVLLRDLPGTLAQLGNGNASSFDRARLGPGIETLTRELQETLQRNQHRLDAPEVTAAFSRLEQALSFFAERVLFVINNTTYDVLEDEFGRNRRVALLPQGEGVQVETRAASDGIDRLAARMAVLQTLGNVLVLHVNDLRRQQRHQQTQRRAGPGELRAAQAALLPGADLAFDAYVLHARNELTRLSAETTRLESTSQAASQAAADRKKVLEKSQTELGVLLETRRDELLKTGYEATFKQLDAAVRTLVPVKDRGGLFAAPTDRVLAGREARDVLDLGQQLTAEPAAPAAGETESTPSVVALAQGWLTKEIGRETTDSPRRARLSALQTVLDPAKGVLSLPADLAVGPESLDELRKAVLAAARLYRGEIDARQGPIQTAQAELDRVKAALKAEQAPDTTASARHGAAQLKSQSARAVLEALEAERSAVITAAANEGVRDAAGLQRLLSAALLRKRDAIGSAEEKKAERAQLQAAVDFVAGLKPPVAFSLAQLPQDNRQIGPSDVLDQVIAGLRQQRIQALARGDSTQAAHLLKAIDAAYEARADGSFIRPASDYLRSVYSSTNLQDGPEKPYRNMLVDYLRNIVSGGSASEYARRTREAREQVEKLSWQNINRVSLSAGGNSNYVLAKDDIGNWYVKAYSADPNKAILSAQSLALFGTGRQINSNLLRRLNLQRLSDDGSNSQASARARTDLDKWDKQESYGLDRVRKRLADSYAAELAAQSASLHETLNGLVDSLAGAVQAEQAKPESPLTHLPGGELRPRLQALAGPLSGVAAEMAKAQALPVGPERTVALEEQHLAALTGLRSLYVAIRPALTAAATSDPKREAAPLGVEETLEAKAAREQTNADVDRRIKARESAAELVRKLTHQQLEGSAARLKATIDRFQAGLHLVGESRASK